MKLLSERLRWAMQQKSQRDGIVVTGADLGRAAGVSKTSVGYWLNDHYGMTATKARLAADFLGVNAYWLETGIGDPARKDGSEPEIKRPSAPMDMDDLLIVVNALREGDEFERDSLVNLSRTIIARAASKKTT